MPKKNKTPHPTFADRNTDGTIRGEVRKTYLSNGKWESKNTISFQYRRFLGMTQRELLEYRNLPSSEKTVAMEIAYGRIIAARKSLPDAKELTDRTEGKAKESVDVTSQGEKLEPVVIYRPEKLDDTEAS